MTLDNNPPTLLYPNKYLFVAIVKPDGHYNLIQSKRFTVSPEYAINRLRYIADTLEAALTVEREAGL